MRYALAPEQRPVPVQLLLLSGAGQPPIAKWKRHTNVPDWWREFHGRIKSNEKWVRPAWSEKREKWWPLCGTERHNCPYTQNFILCRSIFFCSIIYCHCAPSSASVCIAHFESIYLPWFRHLLRLLFLMLVFAKKLLEIVFLVMDLLSLVPLIGINWPKQYLRRMALASAGKPLIAKWAHTYWGRGTTPLMPFWDANIIKTWYMVGHRPNYVHIDWLICR